MKFTTIILVVFAGLCTFCCADSLDGRYVCVSVAPASKDITLSDVEKHAVQNMAETQLFLNPDSSYRLIIGGAEKTGFYVASDGGVLFLQPDPLQPEGSRWDIADKAVVCTFLYSRQQHLHDKPTPVTMKATFRRQ